MSAALLLISGFVLLYFGAEALVRGSSALALRMGISPLIVGITIVAFGTSSPELIVSVGAALTDSPGIALGNVIGSNICNIALILGLAALIHPLKVDRQLIRMDIPVLIGASGLLAVLLLDHSVSRIEGGVMIALLAVYLGYNIRQARSMPRKEDDALPAANPMKPWLSVLASLAGLLLLAGGANLFVGGAIQVAAWLQIPDTVVGLTIVAIGTSLPELATSVVAATRGEGDLSIGNVVGSNIFNIFAILGITALIAPLHSDALSTIDLSVMVLLALLTLPLMRTGFVLSRLEGLFLLLIYCGYTAYLIFTSIAF